MIFIKIIKKKIYIYIKKKNNNIQTKISNNKYLRIIYCK